MMQRQTALPRRRHAICANNIDPLLLQEIARLSSSSSLARHNPRGRRDAIVKSLIDPSLWSQMMNDFPKLAPYYDKNPMINSLETDRHPSTTSSFSKKRSSVVQILDEINLLQNKNVSINSTLDFIALVENLYCGNNNTYYTFEKAMDSMHFLYSNIISSHEKKTVLLLSCLLYGLVLMSSSNNTLLDDDIKVAINNETTVRDIESLLSSSSSSLPNNNITTNHNESIILYYVATVALDASLPWIDAQEAFSKRAKDHNTSVTAFACHYIDTKVLWVLDSQVQHEEWFLTFRENVLRNRMRFETLKRLEDAALNVLGFK